ncbi:MAG: helix-turn-helix domain-containing protein [Firmicutes bacterium]|nr:helix-turn-helix domain-containing protein [Bacillota bacterium]
MVKKLNILILILSIILFGLLVHLYLSNVTLLQALKTESATSYNHLVTDSEVARYLNIPEEDFIAIANRQEQSRKNTIVYGKSSLLPYVKISGKRYYRLELIDEWIENQMISGKGL